MSDTIVSYTIADEAASRWLNAMLGGSPAETFCARVWRERWRHPWLWLVIWRIDRIARQRFGEEPGHCRRAAENHKLWLQERRLRSLDAKADADAIVRLLGV
jgi:hypothetical protein